MRSSNPLDPGDDMRDAQLVDIPLESLTSFPGNPRRGNIQAIAESLQENGQYRPIVVRRETGEVLAGNHVLEAARQLGWSTIRIVYLAGVDDDRAKRIVLADNRTADLGRYDDEALAFLLESINGDLAGTGYDDEALASLLAKLAPQQALTPPDEIPPLPTDPISRLGDVWTLAGNRLIVGDSTDPLVIAAALDGATADLLLTDPPYNVAYTGGTASKLTIANDDMDATSFQGFLTAAFAPAIESLRAGGGIYIFYSTMSAPQFRAALAAGGGRYAQDLVWVKSSPTFGRADYRWQFEPILYGWRPGAAHRWFGGRRQSGVIDDNPADIATLSRERLEELLAQAYDGSDVLRFPKPVRNSDHPTAKPVDLIARLIDNSTAPGNIVLDTFAGSGSTLIAAHQTRRRAALVELDERYADVILRRWQMHTGELPERDGRPVDFTRS